MLIKAKRHSQLLNSHLLLLFYPSLHPSTTPPLIPLSFTLTYLSLQFHTHELAVLPHHLVYSLQCFLPSFPFISFPPTTPFIPSSPASFATPPHYLPSCQQPSFLFSCLLPLFQSPPQQLIFVKACPSLIRDVNLTISESNRGGWVLSHSNGMSMQHPSSVSTSAIYQGASPFTLKACSAIYKGNEGFSHYSQHLFLLKQCPFFYFFFFICCFFNSEHLNPVFLFCFNT